MSHDVSGGLVHQRLKSGREVEHAFGTYYALMLQVVTVAN